MPSRPSREAGFPNYAVYRALILSLPPAYRRDCKLAVQIEMARQQTNDYVDAFAAIFHEHTVRWSAVLARGAAPGPPEDP